MIDPKSDMPTSFLGPLRLVIRNPRLAVAILLGYIGSGLLMAQYLKLDFGTIVQKYGLPALGTLLILAGGYLFISERQRFIGTSERQFIDVDQESRARTRSMESVLEEIRREIQQLRDSSEHNAGEDRLADIVRRTLPSTLDANSLSFSSYYVDLKNVLQEKAANADTKASLLLDRGVGYSKLGIFFFVVSIIVWQVLSWAHGFQPQFVYGVVSCSLLFITIEFLAAWFLRQYVQFVDTSTYLMKVKAIFDRYLLTYLAVLDARIIAAPDKVASTGVLTILKDEIKWPDNAPLKVGDVGFARDMMDSLAALAKALSAATRTDNKHDAA